MQDWYLQIRYFALREVNKATRAFSKSENTLAKEGH